MIIKKKKGKGEEMFINPYSFEYSNLILLQCIVPFIG